MGSTNRFWSLAQRRYGSGSEPGEHLGKGPSHSACPARTPAACALIAQRAAAVAAPKMEVMAACVVISEVGVEVPEMGEVAGVSAERVEVEVRVLVVKKAVYSIVLTNYTSKPRLVAVNMAQLKELPTTIPFLMLTYDGMQGLGNRYSGLMPSTCILTAQKGFEPCLDTIE